MHITLTWCEALLNVSGFLLVTKYRDDPLGCWDFHAQKLLPYYDIKFVDEPSSENREVGMIYVYYVKS
jgi:hypothetical protein